MNELIILFCLVCVGYLAALCGSLYGNYKELKGIVSTLEKAPVLRQYIERYIPVDTSKEAKQKMEESMRKAKEEWDSVMGMDVPGIRVKGARQAAGKNNNKPEDLV